MERLVAAAVLLAVLTACAPMQWSRGDADQEQAAGDLRACRDQAWREASWTSLTYRGALGPALFSDPFGRRYMGWPYYYSPFGDVYGDRFFEESRLTDFCMHAKGYELAPVRK